MRGSPLLRTVIVILILILASIPIWKLTHKAKAVVAAPEAVHAAKTGVRVDLSFVRSPLEFQLLHLGKVIWEEKSPPEMIGKNFEMEFPKEGVDLEIKAAWTSGTPVAAVRVSITHGNGNPIQKSAWGTGSVDEVLTFCESE